MLLCIVLYCIVFYCLVLSWLLLYCIVLYCIVLYCIIGILETLETKGLGFRVCGVGHVYITRVRDLHPDTGGTLASLSHSAVLSKHVQGHFAAYSPAPALEQYLLESVSSLPKLWVLWKGPKLWVLWYIPCLKGPSIDPRSRKPESLQAPRRPGSPLASGGSSSASPRRCTTHPHGTADLTPKP